uniref:PH domain-containing protein n=1 Tax=Ascaris lumbricoides TaxID=6252 RepID=A0A0M3HFK2_ASCLU
MVSAYEVQCCGAWRFGSSHTPFLQINDLGFFTRDCTSAHLSVALRSVSFGNLVHAGKFISHFTRYADCDGVDSRKWLSALRNEKVAHAMFVDFEHDRNLLVVRFAVHDGGYKMKPSEKSAGDKSAHIPASAISLKVQLL